MTASTGRSRRLRAVILGDTSAAPHHGCELVMANLRRGLAHVGIDVVREHSGKGWQTDKRVVASLTSADLLVINGEGTMHHDRPQGYDFVEAAEVAARAGVPAYLLNCTWQQNSRSLAERAQVFRRIHVRESQSAAELASAGTVAVVTPDLTLATDWEPDNPVRHGWVVTDSTMTEVTLELYRISQGLKDSCFAPVIASACPQLGLGRRIKRRLQQYAGQLLNNIGMRTSYVSLSYALPDARAFLKLLSQSEAMLTGRFHAVCFAILTGTPFLALRSNSAKIESLLRDVGLSADRLVERGTPLESIRDRLLRSAFSDAEEQCRRQFLQSARSAIADMFSAVSHDVILCRQDGRDGSPS